MFAPAFLVALFSLGKTNEHIRRKISWRTVRISVGVWRVYQEGGCHVYTPLDRADLPDTWAYAER
jgi:hypothetical protein